MRLHTMPQKKNGSPDKRKDKTPRLSVPNSDLMGCLERGNYLINLQTANRAKQQMCIEFLRAARDAALHENQHPVLHGKASYQFCEVMQVAVNVCLDLVAAGDLRVIGNLPAWKELINTAHAQFGNHFQQKPDEAQWANRFAAFLQKGQLWNNGVIHVVEWPKGTSIPSRCDWKAWTKLTMKYLKGKFGDEPWQIRIFLPMLARRNSAGKCLNKTSDAAKRLLELADHELYQEILALEQTEQAWKSAGQVRLLHSQPTYQWRAIKEELEGAFKLIAKLNKSARAK